MRITSIAKTAPAMVAAIMLVSAPGCGKKGPKSTYERRVLDNGVTVVTQYLAGVNQASAKVLYRNGFVDDGEGHPLMARFTANLMSKSASKSFAAGAAWDLILRRGGHTDVETTPDFTHLTYMVPISDVGLIVQIEAEHIQSLQYDPEIAKLDRQNCYDDVQSVGEQASASIVEYAAMAANQRWRYGLQDVNFRGALDSLSVETVMGYIKTHYAPENMIIVITGALDPSTTADFIEKHLGMLPRGGTLSLPAIDWGALPERTGVKWDIPANGVFVWFEPPEQESDRILLSLWGDTFAQRLNGDTQVKDVAQFVATSSFTWMVGDMPFFVYATLNDGVSTEHAVEVLTERIDKALDAYALEANPAQVVKTARDFAGLKAMTSDIAVRQAAFVARGQNLSNDEALEFVLIRHSLNLGLRELLFGDPVAGHLQEALDLTSVGMQGLLRNLKDARRGVTILEGTNPQ